MKRAFVAVFVALSASISLAQQQASVGRDIYAKASGSVLLLTVVSATGDDVGLGSGFLVDRGKIVTNAHVADSGRVVIQVGPVRIPTKVEKQDSDNDLALLTIETELTLPSLTLAATDPSPGEQIFAIGNPKGLEDNFSRRGFGPQRRGRSQTAPDQQPYFTRFIWWANSQFLRRSCRGCSWIAEIGSEP